VSVASTDRCAALQAEAGLLAALPAAEPARVAALEHAQSCPACTSALEEAAAGLARLDRGGAPSPLEPHRLQVVHAALARELHPLPGWLASAALGPVAVAGGALSLLFAPELLPLGPMWRDGLVFGAVASLAGALSLRLGPASLSIVSAAGVALALFSGGEGLGDPGEHGARCLFQELVGASLPLAAATWALRRRPAALPLAAAAAAGALAGAAGLTVSCAERAAVHLGLFHAGGVVVAALLGAVIARPLALRPID